MRSAGLFGVGLKLALGSDRGAKVRFALMAVSIAVGVAVIVGAFSVLPAIQARDARVAGLEYVATDGRTDAPDQLILTERDSWFEGRRLQRRLVAPIGDAPLPPGLERLPAPGEVVVSPALRELLQGSQRALLDDRLPGRVVGVIDGSGLLHPDELTAYLGVRPREIEEVERAYITEFGLPQHTDQDIPVEVIQAVVFGSMGVLLPVLVFVWTATRMSASIRETRLAALRLAGATPRQVWLLSAVESGLAAIAGTTLGFGLFRGARELLALPVELGLEPSDAIPPLAATIGVGVGIPVLAVVVAWLALRRVTRSPLSVVRKAQTVLDRRPRRGRTRHRHRPVAVGRAGVAPVGRCRPLDRVHPFRLGAHHARRARARSMDRDAGGRMDGAEVRGSGRLAGRSPTRVRWERGRQSLRCDRSGRLRRGYRGGVHRVLRGFGRRSPCVGLAAT